MHLPDLRKLEHVVALAETLHFGRACARVHLSQPALSRSLQSLEETLGVQLFVRDARHVEVTPFGAVVVERARRILFEAAQMRNELQLLATGGYGSVAFGLGATPAVLLAAQMLTATSGLPQGSYVAVKRGASDTLLQMLYDDEIDIFCADIAPLDALEDRSRLHIEPLPQWPVALFCRKGHPLLTGRPVSRAELATFQFASTRLSTFALASMQCELGTHEGFARRLVMESDSFDDLVPATEASDVVLVASRPVVENTPRAHGLKEIPLAPPFAGTGRFGIVRLAGKRLPPLADVLVEIVRRNFEAHAERCAAAAAPSRSPKSPKSPKSPRSPRLRKAGPRA